MIALFYYNELCWKRNRSKVAVLCCEESYDDMEDFWHTILMLSTMPELGVISVSFFIDGGELIHFYLKPFELMSKYFLH